MVEINYFFLEKYMGLTFFGQHTTIWSPDSDGSRAPTQRDLSRVIFVRVECHHLKQMRLLLPMPIATISINFEHFSF